ncbi:hypothetical protein GCM10025881_28490 [Pseudolysinimonas kribbensis]|uniref:HTH gntR-type domain-containing protein n=2 Tax=Pseudolysinimonas kribbensis TaxID=433641 RepID=A0ABQ6KAW6_9MICO|nr:hypothetical protein GCM10025881_28490 [Pseudolysinimonas kribbensis]
MGRVAAPLREQVIAALRQAILDFQLKPGQRLVERELIEQLGVSRTTIREALRELTSEGLVTVVPQRGAMVSAPSLEEAIDLYEVRASLESLVVQHFVERASDEEIDKLRETVRDVAKVAEKTADTREILGAKDAFYLVLIAGARSAALQQLIEGIQARVQVLRATSSRSRDGRTRWWPSSRPSSTRSRRATPRWPRSSRRSTSARRRSPRCTVCARPKRSRPARSLLSFRM